MLGTEPQIVENYVSSGKVKIVFWPVLNHGDASVYSTVAAECVGQQNPQLFWDYHHTLFDSYSQLWSASRDYYVQTAVAVGADQAAFEACYDGPEALAQVQALDALRRERGVFSQPVFDIAGNLYAGAPPYDVFAATIDSVLEAMP